MNGTPMQEHGERRRRFGRQFAGLLLSLPVLGACGRPASTEATRARQHRNIETSVDATLARCYMIAPATRALVADTVGVLVFPTVTLINPVTLEWSGVGAMREGSIFTNYYSLSAAKLGTGQDTAARSILFLFKTLDALNQFRLSKPWRTGGAIAPPNVLCLVLRGNVLMTNPTMPEMLVVPLDV